MKIAVIGTRGFPKIQGGVEKHCESLYSLLIENYQTLQLIIFRRRQYVSIDQTEYNKRIRFLDINVIRNQYIETIYHSFAAACICLFLRPDIVHIHNIGPALVLPLLKIAGLKTVVTYHSDNYNHDKWGPIAKSFLKLGERLAGLLADGVIVVSRKQKHLFAKNCNVDVIPNGIFVQRLSNATTYLERIGAEPYQYVLAVSRIVPEKGLDLLVKAFQAVRTPWKLIIAGDADHETIYSRKLKEQIDIDDNIIRAGYIIGDELNQVYSHAGLFVLPSYHEGLPIALLEAMSYGLSVLVSDIPANLEVNLPQERYFRCGDVQDLVEKMTTLMGRGVSEKEKEDLRSRILAQYNWETIAAQTVAVYSKVLNRE